MLSKWFEDNRDALIGTPSSFFPTIRFCFRVDLLPNASQHGLRILHRLACSCVLDGALRRHMQAIPVVLSLLASYRVVHTDGAMKLHCISLAVSCAVDAQMPSATRGQP